MSYQGTVEPYFDRNKQNGILKVNDFANHSIGEQSKTKQELFKYFWQQLVEKLEYYDVYSR
jgi:hypothetical protein